MIAIRDTSVLALTRAAYHELAEHTPAIVEAVLAALALRFARETARLTPIRASPKARTVALIQGGYEPAPEDFDAACAVDSPRPVPRSSIPPGSRLCFPAGRWIRPRSRTGSTRSSRSRRWWFISAAREDSEWTRKAIRQADMVVFVTHGKAPAAGVLTEVETFACEVHPASARRLVRIHERRSGEVSGTAAWLARLPCLHAPPCRARGSGRYR